MEMEMEMEMEIEMENPRVLFFAHEWVGK